MSFIEVYDIFCFGWEIRKNMISFFVYIVLFVVNYTYYVKDIYIFFVITNIIYLPSLLYTVHLVAQ